MYSFPAFTGAGTERVARYVAASAALKGRPELPTQKASISAMSGIRKTAAVVSVYRHVAHHTWMAGGGRTQRATRDHDS